MTDESDGQEQAAARPSVDPVDVYMALVAREGFDSVTMRAVAEASGLTLTQLRQRFDGPMALLEAFSQRIDAEVLDAIPAELMEDPPRERLFDVLMMRLDILQPYKPALREMMRAVERDPIGLAALLPLSARAQWWMMAGARVDAQGGRGALQAHGLALIFARTLRVWVDDDDPGLARTMAELDRRMREGERWMRRLDGVASFFSRRAGAARPRYPTADEPGAPDGPERDISAG